VQRQALERHAQHLDGAGLVRAFEPEPEAVPAQMTEAQLVAVPRNLEHLEPPAEARRRQPSEPRLLAELHAEPPGNRNPILPACRRAVPAVARASAPPRRRY
jgi:hypothetical protein